MITAQDLEDLGYYDGWQPHKTPMDMVQEFKFTANQQTNIEMSRKLIREEFDEWLIEVLNPNGSNVAELKELCDLIYVIYGYALNRNWDLDEALTRVHENNMGRMFQDDGTIKRREDGKVIKNPLYPKVDLGDLAQ